jgi:predicted small integral membrane protein
VISRIAKIAVVLCVGAIMLLVAIGNIFDYAVNYDVVQHVLAMDTVPETPLKWRAITSPWLHQAFYILIIGTESAASALSLYGGFLLWRERRDLSTPPKARRSPALRWRSCSMSSASWAWAANGS